MNRARFLTTALALAGVASLVTGCAATDAAGSTSDAGGYAVDSGTLVFGVVPDSANAQTNYQPLMDYIAKETGKQVEYHESTDYAALIEASIAGQIDVASFSGLTYVTATQNGAKLDPISSIVTAEGQQPGYYSEAIVPKGSPITSLADMKGKKGYLFPSAELLKAGVDPTKDVTPVFAGKHDVSVQKVGEGRECDAGFAEDSEVDKSDAVTVVDKVMVPGAPIVESDALPADVKQQLKDALSDVTVDQMVAAGVTSADTPGFRSVFYATTPVDDAYYDQVRETCETTKSAQCQKK
jgi:phosphonate transport system substrate-binding protein